MMRCYISRKIISLCLLIVVLSFVECADYNVDLLVGLVNADFLREKNVLRIEIVVINSTTSPVWVVSDQFVGKYDVYGLENGEYINYSGKVVLADRQISLCQKLDVGEGAILGFEITLRERNWDELRLSLAYSISGDSQLWSAERYSSQIVLGISGDNVELIGSESSEIVDTLLIEGEMSE